MNLLEALVGARIRRIDAPRADLWAITLAAGATRGTLLISLHPDVPGVGFVEQRPQGLAATGFVQKLRKALEGGRVLEFVPDTGRGLALRVGRTQHDLRLVFELRERDVLLFGPQAELLASLRPPQPSAAAAEAPPERAARFGWPRDLETLQAQGLALLAARGESLLSARRSGLLRGIETARKRLARKLDAMAVDAARADKAPELRTRGSLLLANLHAVPRGAARVSLLDYTLDPPAEVELALDPKLGAREQAEAWFRQAKRFERGATHAAARAALLAPEFERLAALKTEVEQAVDADALEPLHARAVKLGVRVELATEEPAKRPAPQRHVPYRTLYGYKDRVILVGKGAADNDELTLHHARPQDLWLHAREVSGAHVVVPMERGEVLASELLVDAAMLAAHFSDARGELAVDVSYVGRRFVRKPKGAAVGSVQIERAKVLRVRIDPTRLSQLLATQRD